MADNREKINSIYVPKSNHDGIQALKAFKEQKEAKLHSLSHTDLYLAGLGLFNANQKLIKPCQMLSTVKPDDIIAFLTMFLDGSTGAKTFDNDKLAQIASLLDQQNKQIENLNQVITEQNAKLQSLSKGGVEVITSETSTNNATHNTAFNEDGSLKMEETIKENVPVKKSKRKRPGNFCS